MTDTIYRSGAKTIDGTTTTATWAIPGSLHGGLKIQAGDITGLTYTFQVSYDEGTTYLNVIATTSEGIGVSGGGTVTAIDGVACLFPAGGVTNVQVTRTGGSGPIYLIEDRDCVEYIAAINRQSQGSPAGRFTQNTTLTSTTTETTILSAAGAGVSTNLYALIIENTSATACEVTIREDTGGTIKTNIEVPATDTRGFWGPTSAGMTQGATNKPWTAQCGTSVASIKITAVYTKVS